jgi:hypothetical protein
MRPARHETGRYRNGADVEIQNLGGLETTRRDFSYARVGVNIQPMIWRNAKSTLAGRSASRRMYHGYQASP